MQLELADEEVVNLLKNIFSLVSESQLAGLSFSSAFLTLSLASVIVSPTFASALYTVSNWLPTFIKFLINSELFTADGKNSVIMFTQ